MRRTDRCWRACELGRESRRAGRWIARIGMILLLLASLPPALCEARPPAHVRPLEVALPSAEPSGIPVNDTIWLSYFPAIQPKEQPAPAVVMLHALGETHLRLTGRFARYLAARGIGCAVMTLPYHMRRRPQGVRSGGPFTSPDVNWVIRAASQSNSDVSTVVTWLSQQPSVDPHRIGVVGISLGAIIAHVAMGKDARLSAGVAILGGGNLADLLRSSLVFKLHGEYPAEELSPDQLDRLRQVDPLSYAGTNRPRRVLMIEAARDLLVPPRDARALWEALGRPPIRWVDTNHFGLSLLPRSVTRITAAYLHSVWDTQPAEAPALPALHAITLKLGMISGLGAALAPAIEWQVHSFAMRPDHLSLLHADLGWSGRGFFLGLAATVNSSLDLGFGRRFNGGSVRPYLSLHIVF